MTKEVIWQLWKEYKDTNDVSLLIDAVRYADFNGESEIQQEIIKILERSSQGGQHYKKVRNRDIARVHSINLENGMTIQQSYNAIARVERITPDAIRKVLEKKRKKD